MTKHRNLLQYIAFMRILSRLKCNDTLTGEPEEPGPICMKNEDFFNVVRSIEVRLKDRRRGKFGDEENRHSEFLELSENIVNEILNEFIRLGLIKKIPRKESKSRNKRYFICFKKNEFKTTINDFLQNLSGARLSEGESLYEHPQLRLMDQILTSINVSLECYPLPLEE